jgi:hypothetical protein
MSEDRELPDPDNVELPTAIAMLSAMRRKDVEALSVLGKYADGTDLVWAFAALTLDALYEPRTLDLESYVERLFTRLERSRQQ